MQHTVVAELVANVAEVNVAIGDAVSVGQSLVLLESMKMEIPVLAERAGIVTDVAISVGEVVREGDVIAVIES